MKKKAILSVLGPDQVGIANDLTAALGQYGLDIESSRMTTLQGRFAVLMEVSGDEAGVAKLLGDLSNLSARLGFDLQLEPLETVDVKEAAPRVSRQPGREVLIESFSSEPSGLNALTGILKRRHVNIEELETEASSAPCTSRVTFHMRVRGEVPGSCSIDRLGEELRKLEQGRDMDIVFKRGSRIVGPRVPEKTS